MSIVLKLGMPMGRHSNTNWQNGSVRLWILIQFFLLVPAAMGCGQQTPVDPIPPHDSFSLDSKEVGETRVICVWKPPGYTSGQEHYPVLYMPDGGIKEDFPHIANTVAELVGRGDIPPMLVVGIENTQRRRDLTGPSEIESDAQIAPVTDGSSKFRAFIVKELFPEIQKRYRVNDRRAIVGESAAGLFVVETLLLQPDAFEVYIAMDPALYWNGQYLVRTGPEHLDRFPGNDIAFWFAASDTVDIFPSTESFSHMLEKHAPKNLTWKFTPERGEKHNTIFRATKENAFRWALPKLKPESETKK